MLAALRYRRGLVVVLLVLSALVTAAVTAAPLYTRALEQATVGALLRDASADRTGLRLTSSSSTEPYLALAPPALVDLVPAGLLAVFGEPITGTAVGVRRMPLLGEPEGRLLARQGMCEHIRLVTGRCPTARGEVAVSADQSAAYQMPLGHELAVGEWDGSVSRPEAAPRTTLRVVGIYEQVDEAYWFGDRLTGRAARRLGLDTMLTAAATLTEPVTAPDGVGSVAWIEPHHVADLPLLPERVGSDDIAELGAAVADLVEHPLGVARAGSRVAATVTVRSGLPAIAQEARVGATQAAVTVPLLMAQLGLLLICVLWLVLVAAADQRRAEVAVARLRGRGARGARRLLLAETLPPVLAGLPVGAALALAAVTVARHTVLTPRPPLDVPPGAVLALLLGAALMVALAQLSVRRVCREPVGALVRTVPPRPAGVRLGVLEAMLVAAAGAAFAALLTGAVQGPVGQIAPTLLAVAVGVFAARVLAAALGAAGRRLLRRGRSTTGVALLSAGRRPTTRWLVPVVAVALCIVVVATDLAAIGARNWTGRAAVEVGAPTVLELGSADLAAATRAVRAVDPAGRQLTPVAVLAPAVDGGPTTVGVLPDAFGRIALWPGLDTGAIPWQRLTAPDVPPLLVTGTRATYHVEAPPFRAELPDPLRSPTALSLGLLVVREDGSVEPIPLGPLPIAGISGDREISLECADGCRVAGIGVLAPPSASPATGSVALSRLTVDGHLVDLGGPGTWRAASADGEVSGQAADGVLRLAYATGGQRAVMLPHASMPLVIPSLTTAPATPRGEATFAGSYGDGSQVLLRSAGQVAYVPGGPQSAALVHLDNLLTQRWQGRGSLTIAAYLDSDDPARVAEVVESLAAQDIPVVAQRHPGPAAAAYARSAAARSLQLAIAVAVLALLVAGVGIIVLAATSAQARGRDLAGLRLAGQHPRATALVAQLETAPVVVLAAVLGAGSGLWAAPAAVGMAPLFTTAPAAFPVDLRPAWGPALLAAAVGTAALTAVALLANHRVARRADPQRLRESG